MHRNRHIIGIFLLILSLGPFVLPEYFNTGTTLTLFYFFYCFGVVLIGDYITYNIAGQSLLDNILKNSSFRFRYIVIGVIAGLILDGFAAYLGGLWYYPYYSFLSYFIMVSVMGGFAMYWFCILVSYEAVKVVLDKYFGGTKHITRSFKYENIFYTSLGVLGTFGISIVLYEVLHSTKMFSDFFLIINDYKKPYLSFWYIILTFFSLTFLLEFIEFKRHRTSLFKDILHGYYIPLVAIVVVSFVLSIYMEFQNLPLKLWVYANWPAIDIALGGIPILVFFAWPLHYIFFLSFYRAFGDRSSSAVWNKTILK